MKLILKISRWNAFQDKVQRIESYEIEYCKGMTVLNALEWIRRNLDSTLSFRWNCSAGKCGSCAIEIDGKPMLACKAKIPAGVHEISIAPMKIFPVVKDLVVDLKSMRDAIKAIPGFTASSKPFFKIHDSDIEIAQEMRKCIECGICQDVCHVIREHKKDYAGPRAAVKATSLEMHAYDIHKRAEAMEKLGLNYCNLSQCCQSFCPENIRITHNAIIPFKEKVANLRRSRIFNKILGGNKK